MAAVKVEKAVTSIKDPAKVAFKSVSGDFALDLKGKDFKTVILFRATAGTPKVTIPVGNALGGVGTGLDFTMATGEVRTLVVDSSYYKTVSGENKGCLVGKSNAAVDVAVIHLP